MPTVEGLTAARIQELLDLKADLAMLDDLADASEVTSALALKADLVSGRVAYSQLPTDIVQDSDLSTKADLVSGRVAYSQLPTDLATDSELATKADGSAVSAALAAVPTYSELGMNAADSSKSVQLGSSAHFAGMPTPAEQGFAAWTFPPESIQSGKAGSAGAVYISQFYIAKAVNITKLAWGINVAGASPTSAQNWLGVYDSSGVLKCSVDVTSRVTSAGAFLETVSSTALAVGSYWMAFLFNASSMPQIMRGSDVTSNVSNLNRTAANMRFAVAATGRTTLASSYTPSSNVTNATSYWGAVA